MAKSSPGAEHNIPGLQGCAAAQTTIAYPYSPPSNAGPDGGDNALNCGLAITWGIDNHLKTPYSYALDFSFQRELPGGFIFEENYVGRLGRHLLQQMDLAEPVNLVDSQGGGDYFHAAAQLSKISDQHGGDPGANVQPIQYFEDMFPFMANIDGPGESATQAVYSDEWAPTRYGNGETTALYDLDLYDDPNGPDFRFFQSQFSSLYAWSSIGTSSYHALQFTLRHPSSHGLTTDVSYTLSKSLDMGSGVERANEFSADCSKHQLNQVCGRKKRLLYAVRVGGGQNHRIGSLRHDSHQGESHHGRRLHRSGRGKRSRLRRPSARRGGSGKLLG